MKKKALEDDIFNAVLEQAFKEAVAEEFADVPAVQVQSQVLPKKKRTKRKWIICVGLLIAFVGVVLLFLLMKTGSDGYLIETPEYVFGYIPEEYVMIRQDDCWQKYWFENTTDNTYICVSYLPASETKVSVNNNKKQTTLTEVTINGKIAYLTYFNVDNSYCLVWSDNANIFTLDSNTSKETLLKVAEHIVRKPQ